MAYFILYDIVDKNKFIKIIEEKRNAEMGYICDPDVGLLYRMLDESEKDIDTDETINTFQHSQHAHFFLGIEEIEISYTDLFLNLLFSRGAFEEFFDLEKQKEFFNLWRSNHRSDALSLYNATIQEAAKEKWVPEKFAKTQALEWLKDYIRNPMMI